MSIRESSPDAAKRPVTVLAGPHGHPFHPIAVTVPIGAWVASSVFDFASRWSGDATVFATGARWLIVVGLIGAVAAATLGVLDLIAIPAGTRARRTAYTHMGLNVGVTVLYAVSFALRDGEGPVPWGPITISAIALAVLGASGWLGGKLTYRYGVRVVDDATQADGFTRR